jgi:hypothetical protein
MQRRPVRGLADERVRVDLAATRDRHLLEVLDQRSVVDES